MSVNKLLTRIVAPKIDLNSCSDVDQQAAFLHDHTCGITSDPLTQFAVVLSALIHGEAQEENPMREQVLSCDLLTVGSCSSFGLSKRNDQWCRLENSTDHNKLACCGASFADCCNPNPAGIAVAVVLCVAMTTILVGLAVALQRRRSRSGGAAARQQCQWYNQCRRRGRESE
jgi:hypothetical protein